MNSVIPQPVDSLGRPDPAQAHFEHERVALVLKEFKLTDHLRGLLDDAGKRTGRRRLTFASFRRAFPTFPILLEARWLANVGENCRPVRLLRDFEGRFHLPAYQGVYAQYRQEAQKRLIGMVMPFDAYRHGVVLHNGTFDTRSTKIIHDVRGDLPPHRLTLEPFLPFLRYLARGPWTPATPLPAERQTQRQRVRHGGRMYPWMVRALGAGPATIIFAWLYAVHHSTSGYDRLYVRRLDDGERGVATDRAQIAGETWLSEPQVKRGLAALRAKDFIATERRQGRTLIRLNHEEVRQARAKQRVPCRVGVS